MTATPPQSPLLDYIQHTATRPGMFFGASDLDHVSLHLGGWQAHRRHFPDGDAFADHFFENFHAFVASHYGDTRSLGWADLIRTHTTKKEEGFDTFLSLLAQFAGGYAAQG